MSLATFFIKQKFFYDEVIFWRFCNLRLKMTVAPVEKPKGKILGIHFFFKFKILAVLSGRWDPVGLGKSIIGSFFTFLDT